MSTDAPRPVGLSAAGTGGAEEPTPAGDGRGRAAERTPERTSGGKRRRRLRAILAGDVAGFSSRVAVEETGALASLSSIRVIAVEELNAYDGWLFGMPGDGVFAVFESSIDAIECAMAIQKRIAASRDADGMKMRIGVHAGEVLFENDIPFGEVLAIAARLESLAEPGGILASDLVVDAVSARTRALFVPRGTPRLKNIPRRIKTYSVEPLIDSGPPQPQTAGDALDQTMVLTPVTSERFSRDLIDNVTAALSLALGPIASVIVERKIHNFNSLEELVACLAAEIADPEARRAFVARMERGR